MTELVPAGASDEAAAERDKFPAILAVAADQPGVLEGVEVERAWVADDESYAAYQRGGLAGELYRVRLRDGKFTVSDTAIGQRSKQ